jgi:hypothetical protein
MKARVCSRGVKGGGGGIAGGIAGFTCGGTLGPLIPAACGGTLGPLIPAGVGTFRPVSGQLGPGSDPLGPVGGVDVNTGCLNRTCGVYNSLLPAAGDISPSVGCGWEGPGGTGGCGLGGSGGSTFISSFHSFAILARLVSLCTSVFT